MLCGPRVPADTTEVASDSPLMEIGLDSLSMVHFRNTLQASFGMSRREVQSMLHEFDAIAQSSATAREQEVVNVRHQITEARRRISSSHSSLPIKFFS